MNASQGIPMAGNLDAEYLHETRGYKLISIASVLIVAMLTAVGARLLARRLKNLPLHLDDYLIVSAMFGAVILCTVSIISVQLVGLGHHIEAATMINHNAIALMKRLLFAHHVVAYAGVIVLAKLSVLVFYNRVFHERWVRHASYMIGSVTIALGVVVFISPFVICRPMNWIFDGNKNDGHCIDWQKYLTFISLPNILTDVLLLAVPLPTVWRLSMTFWQKVGLTFAFTLGGLNIVASCVRFYVFWDWSSHVSEDLSWHAVDPATWVLVESGTLVIAACIPHLRPLVSWLVPKDTNRDNVHHATTTPGGLFGPARRLAKKMKGMGHDTRGWWMLSFPENSKSLVAREWEPWDGQCPGQEKSQESRMEHWLEDVEPGFAKETSWLPPDGIIMTEEVVIVISDAEPPQTDEKT